MLCEDWEFGELFRNCKQMMKDGKYPDMATVHQKVTDKMMDIAGRRPYFILGSHFRFPTYMIIGVIYPKKDERKKEG